MATTTKARVVEAAMAVLQATPKMRLGITVLNKALFYADLCALRDTGQPLTRAKYIALAQGPVVAHYERSVVRNLGKEGLAEKIEDGWEKPVVVRRRLKKFDHLTPKQRQIAEFVARKIHAKSATWISEYSHENLAWQEAFRSGVGSEIDMNLALQQIIEDDPWLETESEREVLSAFTTAKDDAGVPF